MPTYEYRCGGCGRVTEAVQTFTDAPLTVCPACGEAALRKLFGNVGVVFKGSGFYRTDSRSESKSTKAEGAKEGAAGTTGSDSGKTGGEPKTKPQPKSEPTKAGAPAKPAAPATA